MEEQINILRYETRKKVIDVNLNGMFLTNTAAGRQMLKQRMGSGMQKYLLEWHGER